ncbi:MAG: hypothetical protein WAU90_04410 [Methyloceanibacter sp.]
MLIVGGALALTAIGVFFLWRFIVSCRALWRKRRRSAAAREKATERIGAE